MPSSHEDRIRRALEAEDSIMLEGNETESQEPSLLDMVEEGIQATDRYLTQLQHIRSFLEINREEDLPYLVRASLQQTLVPVYRNSRQFNQL